MQCNLIKNPEKLIDSFIRQSSFDELFIHQRRSSHAGKISALKINKTAFTTLKSVECTAFKINGKGILRPQRSYEIIHQEASKRFIIKSVNISLEQIGRINTNVNSAIEWCCSGCSGCAKVEIARGGGRSSWTCKADCELCTTIVNLPSEVVNHYMGVMNGINIKDKTSVPAGLCEHDQ